MACDSCTWAIQRASITFASRQSSINFLQDHGILVRNVMCSSCGNPASFSPAKCLWRCQKRHKQKKGHKIIETRCNFKRSVRADSRMENTNLSLEKACTFLAMYILLNPPHQQVLMDELGFSSSTVCDWSSFIREVLEVWCLNNSNERLGEPGHVVEIDEAKFGKRKHNCGRIIEGTWIFGGFDRTTEQVFMEPVPNRSAATLLEIIKRRIEPDTTIMSDCWRAYNCLDQQGYEHLTVNHTYNFVDPDSGAYTQNVERVWRDARGDMPKYGRRDYHMTGYIAEFLFRRRYPHHTDRLHNLGIAIRDIYENYKSL